MREPYTPEAWQPEDFRAPDCATDGLCHNAEPGSFNHECGRPAAWLGTKANGFRSGFCDRCKVDGFEARAFSNWTPRAA